MPDRIALDSPPLRGYPVRMKRCNRCAQILPLSCFSKDKTTKDGLSNRCSSCKKEIRDKKQNRSGRKNITNLIDANIWLQENFPSYEVLKWGQKGESTILDKDRNVKFEYVFFRFKDKLKKNPNRIFNPTKKELSEKIKSSFQNKYGVDCALKVDEFKKKAQKTNLERYGSTNATKNEEVKNKMKQTHLKNWGVENPQQNEVTRQKTKETMAEKYGVEYPYQDEKIMKDVAKKSLNTKMEKGTAKVFEGKTARAIKNEQIRQKTKETMMKKYGADHYSKTQDYRDRVKKTSLEKYGVENAMKNEKIRQRQRESLQENWGVDFPLRNKELKEKRAETNLARHGVKYSWEDPDIHKKAMTTLKENKDDILQKRTETNLERWGVENPRQNKEIDQKIRSTNLEKYGAEHSFQAEETQKKILDTKIKKGSIKVFDGKLLKEIAEEKKWSYSHFNRLVRTHGYEKASQMEKSHSSLQFDIREFLVNQNTSFKEDKRLKGREFDFCIEDKKLIIECDGLFYHSDHPSPKASKDKKYHVDKLRHYEEAGYTALFFREDELREKFPIVKSIILNKLGRSQRVFARKTKIQNVSAKVARDFYRENHLMGNGTGRTYGLYFEGELVCAIQMRWRRKKEKILDVSRFCCKSGYNVVGGFSKLLKHSIKEEDPNKVETFIDRRYGQGRYLSSLGFAKENEDVSFSWTDGEKVYHRMNFRGHTGYEYGLRKIWDCGQAKWSLWCKRKESV